MQNTSIGRAVLLRPVAIPAIMLVAAPVSQAAAMSFVGILALEV